MPQRESEPVNVGGTYIKQREEKAFVCGIDKGDTVGKSKGNTWVMIRSECLVPVRTVFDGSEYGS